MSFVFRYRLFEEDVQTYHFPLSHVYSCEKVEYLKTRDFDIALLKMDRPVDRNVAFPLYHQSANDRLSESDEVYMVGHPDGLPQKITDGAIVRSTNLFHALTNLDAYKGNSGSPVFNKQTNLIEGVLIFGERDYVREPEGLCNVSKICRDEECTGDAVGFIPEELSELIYSFKDSSVKISYR